MSGTIRKGGGGGAAVNGGAVLGLTVLYDQGHQWFSCVIFNLPEHWPLSWNVPSPHVAHFIGSVYTKPAWHLHCPNLALGIIVISSIYTKNREWNS